MLRITLPTREECPIFILEGKLAGLWVREFIRVTGHLCPGTTAVFDIENVFYVDSLGEETLRWLNRLGAAFIAENVYGRDLCKRLRLHRTTENRATNQPRQKTGKTTSSPLSSSSKP
ncbi:MAG: hypothetical protein P4K86_11315 [Terracidiphilus sp.]|nr:hypothetical protein [Terracidiphilus sp.]MDR3776203.1 hypothetical protein [Terracidiphilus sp.]